jgi:hypothetical protein
MNKLKPYLILLIIISLVFGIYGIYETISIHNEPVQIHNIYIQEEELALKDFKLVSFHNHQYIQNNFYFELDNHDKKITNLSMIMSLEGKEILSLAAANPFYRDDTDYIDIEKVIDNLKLSKESILEVKLSYVVDGKKKDFYENIKLEDTIKDK